MIILPHNHQVRSKNQSLRIILGGLGNPDLYFCYADTYCDTFTVPGTRSNVIELDWCFNNFDSYTNYENGFLYRSTAGPSGPWTLIYTDVGINYYYVDSDVAPGQKYWYKFQAQISGALTGFITTSVTDGNQCDPLLTTSSLSCDATAVLSWSIMTAAVSYHIERSVVGGGVGFGPLATVVGATTYTDAPSPANRFYYRVRADYGSLLSPWSNEVSVVAGVGLLHFPQHVIFSTAYAVGSTDNSNVYECTDFGAADCGQPTWHIVTPPGFHGGPFTVIGTTLYMENGDGLWSRDVAFGSAWTQVYVDDAHYAHAHGLWQGYDNPTFAAQCDNTTQWTNAGGSFFNHFINNQIAMSSGSNRVGCIAFTPYTGLYLTDIVGAGKSGVALQPGSVLPVSPAPHFAAYSDEPLYEIALVYTSLFSGDVHLYNNTTDMGILDVLYRFQADAGDANNLWIWNDAIGVKHSTDGGATLSSPMPLSDSPNGPGALNLEVIPGQPADVIRIATDSKMITSHNGGATWSEFQVYYPVPNVHGGAGARHILYTPRGMSERLFLLHFGTATNISLYASEDDGHTLWNKSSALAGEAFTAAVSIWADPTS